MSGYVIGVDGGGTRTRALATDLEGTVLGRGEGPSALLGATSVRRVAEVVRAAARDAATDAGLSLPADALFVGVAGAGRSSLRRALTDLLEGDGTAERVGVDTDVALAARDGLGDGPGIVLLAGTGSIAWGRAPDGSAGRVGGWGTLLGDEGSGYAIGLAGLRAVVRARDGRGPETGLSDALLRAAGVAEPEDLIGWVARATKADVAALAPVVARAARSDATADGILARAADELAEQAAVLATRLGPWDPEGPRIVLAGGILSPHEPTCARVRAALEARGLQVADHVVDGVEGAAALARALLA